MKGAKTDSQGRGAQAVEWDEVRRRMENARAAVEQGATPSQSEKAAILKARAQALAQDPDEKEAAVETLEVLEFSLADESYGVETSFVREVYSLKELTPLPGTPPFVLGITSVRGEILSVIDIRRFLDLPETKVTEHSKVVIAHAESMEFGILADHISGVRSIPLEEIQSSLPTLTGARAEYLRGVTKERTAILDAETILSGEKIAVAE